MLASKDRTIITGAHGFPASIQVESLIAIIRAQGQNLLGLQNQVVLGYQKPLKAEIPTVIGQNIRNVLQFPRERDVYAQIKDLLSRMNESDEIGFLAEEEEHSISQKGYWVIDPICNIRTYIDGGKDWSISIGFALGGRPTGGVIYYPTKGEFLYTAEDGQSHRRIEDATSKRETALLRYSSTKDDSADTLCAAFAKTHKGCLLQTHNPDILSNVALLAIASRLEVKPLLRPDLPFALIPQ